jgi:hypothetical protein
VGQNLNHPRGARAQLDKIARHGIRRTIGERDEGAGRSLSSSIRANNPALVSWPIQRSAVVGGTPEACGMMVRRQFRSFEQD